MDHGELLAVPGGSGGSGPCAGAARRRVSSAPRCPITPGRARQKSKVVAQSPCQLARTVTSSCRSPAGRTATRGRSIRASGRGPGCGPGRGGRGWRLRVAVGPPPKASDPDRRGRARGKRVDAPPSNVTVPAAARVRPSPVLSSCRCPQQLRNPRDLNKRQGRVWQSHGSVGRRPHAGRR